MRPSRVAVAVLAASLVSACGSPSNEQRAAEPSAVEPSAVEDSAAEASAVPSAGCDRPVNPVRLERRTVAVAELERWYLVTVPEATTPGDAPTPRPLVLDFHGFSEGAEAHAGVSLIGDAAEREGFVAVVPHGSGDPSRWAAGPAGSASGPNADLDFVVALLDRVERDECIDVSRVYAIGISNGAMLSSLVACRLADRFAAVAPLAGVTAYDDCDPAAPVPMLTVHGTADPILRFNGGVGDLVLRASSGDVEGAPPTSAPPAADLDGPGAPAAVAAWARRNGCDDDPTDTALTASVVHRVFDCPSGVDVEMYIVVGGGHTWPGSRVTEALAPVFGPTTFDIDATEVAWEFVHRFRRTT